MVYDVHQCARFCDDSKHSHEKELRRVIRYLIGTVINDRTKRGVNQGIVYKPDKIRMSRHLLMFILLDNEVRLGQMISPQQCQE